MTNQETEPKTSASISTTNSKEWWKLLTGYHWFVLLVASAAWFFDCLDQRIFSLARNPALASLMHAGPGSPEVQNFGKVVTAWFLIGWGIGGMIFGALGDRYGRARMLTITILVYSAFTGLSFFSQTKVDFTIFRFLTGLGVGGVFGLAVALIAETVPSGARAQSLGLLQVLSTIGNVTAGFTLKGFSTLEASGTIAPSTGWRWMFLVGAVPAAMVILTGKYLREPEPWLRLKLEGRLPKGGIFAPYRGLVTDHRWRKNLIVGALIAATGVVGLWAIGEYAVDLQSAVFTSHFKAHVPADVSDSAKWIKAQVDSAKFWAYLLNMFGAATGMWIFTRFANAYGRKPAFAIGFSMALVVTAFVYWKMNSPQDAYWMMFLMGAAQLGVFAGFAIYLPELFPSRLRSTGTSFCYNLGRFAAAGGSFFSSILSQNVFGHFEKPLPYRYSAMTMCVLFLVGLIALNFAPETKGQPLPED
jgi:MFS family permease